MANFSPEIAASAIIPKDLLGQASSLHFSMHIHQNFVEAALSEAAGGDFHWGGHFKIDQNASGHQSAIDFINERNWNEKVFRKCTISFDTGNFCLVPKAFFNVDKQKEILQFGVGNLEGEVSHIDLPETDAVLVYEIPIWLNVFSRKFPNARLMPSAYLFARHTRIVAPKDRDFIGVYLSHTFMILAVYNKKNIILLNHFNAQNEEDVLYHCSNISMRLNLDFENVEMLIYDNSERQRNESVLNTYNRTCKQAFSDRRESWSLSFISLLHVICE